MRIYVMSVWTSQTNYDIRNSTFMTNIKSMALNSLRTCKFVRYSISLNININNTKMIHSDSSYPNCYNVWYGLMLQKDHDNLHTKWLADVVPVVILCSTNSNIVATHNMCVFKTI